MHVLEERQAYTRFKSAVLAFSDDPSPTNFARYLAASQALEDAREAEEHAALATARNDTSGAAA